MSLVLVTYSGCTEEHGFPVTGFKIMEKDVWQQHLRDAQRYFEDENLTFYFGDCDDQIEYTDFDAYTEAYHIQAVSDLQADMIRQGVRRYDSCEGWGIWRQGDFDE